MSCKIRNLGVEDYLEKGRTGWVLRGWRGGEPGERWSWWNSHRTPISELALRNWTNPERYYIDILQPRGNIFRVLPAFWRNLIGWGPRRCCGAFGRVARFRPTHTCSSCWWRTTQIVVWKMNLNVNKKWIGFSHYLMTDSSCTCW